MPSAQTVAMEMGLKAAKEAGYFERDLSELASYLVGYYERAREIAREAQKEFEAHLGRFEP